jgi:hypothetical protein
VRSNRHLIKGAFLSDRAGDRYQLTLLRDGDQVRTFVTARPDVFAAANHLLDHSDNPEDLGRRWSTVESEAGVVHLDQLPGSNGTLGDDLVLEVDRMDTGIPLGRRHAES